MKAEFKEFIVITADGYTYDNSDEEFCNFQVLDFIIARNLDETILEFRKIDLETTKIYRYLI